MKGNNRVPVASEDLAGTLVRYSPVLYRLALHRLGNREDAVQDALVSAFTHISQFRGRSRVSTWLYRIGANASGMQLRRRKNRTFTQTGKKVGPPLEDQLADSGLNPEQSFGQMELRDIVQEFLKDLSSRLRKALQMRDLDGWSVAESARAVGVTKNALKARAQRACRQLGTLLAGCGVADGTPDESVVSQV